MNKDEENYIELPELLSQENISDIDLSEKYFKLFEAMNPKGKYQRLMFIMIFLVCFIITTITLMFPFNKALPDYECINLGDYKDKESTYSSNKNRFTIIKEEQCVKKSLKTDQIVENFY